MSKKIAVGVDIGGTGIKSAPVNLKNGKFAEERYRIPTPQPSTPDAIARTVAKCITRFEPSADTAVGVAFPGVIQHGVVKTAANLDESWIGVNLRELIRQHAGHDVFVMNDADAAGFGEHRYGAAHGADGVILMTTLGTGIGSALIADGELVPNTEFGHTIIDGEIAEHWAAESARTRLDLDWDGWIVNLQRFYDEMEKLLWPDLIIVGGGVSKSHHMFLPKLNLRAPIIPAELRNGAGIVGAASWAAAAAKRADKREKASAKDAQKKPSKKPKK
ncbi:polyphosphate--glucose phosphotransferase [Demequina globuliformis]|uniref:polyphosphate--glucose phosphotransferase n=1 Tax=Demequina globuliformis TaxID=676202 RepID=UPI0007837B61|nr:ROK family protein [Demequina globuliformis]